MNATDNENQDEDNRPPLSERRYDTGHLNPPVKEKPRQRTGNEAIAVIGMAGFFPRSNSLEDFCNRLDQQESLFIKPPPNHFPATAVSERYGAFLDNIAQFDPEVFKITPVEAEYLDPRQRLLLMSVWHALEDACYSPDALSDSRTDVYIASEGCPYTSFVREAEITPYSPTGPSSWSLPNRISHTFKFRGKSIFIDTACSGSLVAVHQAIQALRRNESDLAVVGAANLLFGDQVLLAYLGQESLGILGDSQTCYPFQQNATGFLPAEGVVTVVLKRLSEAIRDNDNIHAVLLGSHVNHAGGAGTLTLPSAEAQSEAIVGAYREAQIPPWTVTYIEAHGASSVLADAEEIQAFKTADRKLRDQFPVKSQPPCKISTLKPNIGHANSVSGLMSLVRVVHSLKHAKKLGIKNFAGCSDRISLDSTRFYINGETEFWEQLTDEAGLPIPRRAAINNFGAGGVNVHLLLEEFVQPTLDTSAALAPSSTGNAVYFLALSSLHAGQLQEQVHSLIAYLADTTPSVPPEDLEMLLISSRKAFPCRLVFRYKSLDDLLAKLRRYKESNGMKAYHLKRDTRDRNESAELFYKHPQLSKFLSTLDQDRDKAILFELWSLGIEEPIYNHYRERRCLKRSLPRYPFALKEFWVRPRQPDPADRSEYRSSSLLSPLLHQNTSDLSEQKYSSVFTGDEFFLAEHVVLGQRVLPGVAYLEMARAAVVQATHSTDNPTGIRLKNIVWTKPVIVGEGPKAVHIRLRPGEDGCVDFEIYSSSPADTSALTVHAQGSARLISVEKGPSVDIEAYRLDCNEFTLAAEECYRAFRSVGIDHGPAFQGLDVIHGKSGLLIAKIAFPASVLSTRDQFVLHPSIMDGAFQASIGLVAGNSASGMAGPTEATLPFALHELEVFASCSQDTWAIIRSSPGSHSTSRVKRVDIDLCDDAGGVCVRMKGFATRPVEADAGRTTSTNEQQRDRAPDPNRQLEEESPASVRNVPSSRLTQRIEAVLVSAVLRFLRTTDKQLDLDAEFSSFGFDSVSLTAFVNELNRTHKLDLDPTLFFEYPTIRQFAEYLANAHGDYFAKSLEVAAEEAPRSSPNPPETTPEGLKPTTRFSASKWPPETSPDSRSPEPIAIVGMCGRFPMADDVDEFWQNLIEGRDCITEVPPDRWNWREIYGDPKTEENKTNIKWGGFISGVDEFDPLFFGISPKEAELMDPQQRLLMMFVWNAIEDAGYAAQRLSGTNTGIFVATGASGYGSIIAKANVPIEAYTSTGMVPSVGPNRMSYYLNFHGPSEPIETACSSSLVAIHRAVAAIRTGSCDMAIAGGVSTMLTPDLHISFSKAGMLCDDGRCKTFSDRANGYVRGEGAGMLFLKKLRDAEQDGDHIYGVILGSAENHGGRTNSLTAPNPRAQADVVMAAHRDAGIDPRSISYVEAHGTGTGLGDPIEINGLKLAFADEGGGAESHIPAEAYCGVGSVKTNIGHLELAAGVSGVIKVLLQMKHRRLAKSLHCERVNPYIQLDHSPFYIVKEARDWEGPREADGKALPRRAGVSSFGFGGVNAHVALEEYVPRHFELAGVDPNPAEEAEAAVLLSGRNADRLRERAQQLCDYLRENREKVNPDRLCDIAFTLQVGREAMEARLAVTVNSLSDLEDKLARWLAGHEETGSLFHGMVDRQNAVLSMFKDDAELREAVDRWLQRGKVRELSEFWVRGLAVDWDKLHRNAKRRRVSLPGYPFARQRCWVANQQPPVPASKLAASAGALHPLVHCNTSTLREQSYSSTFSRDEYFLADHVLRGVRILPGVVYLEMARAAIHHATQDSSNWKRLRLQRVAWTSPFTVKEGPRTIDVLLTPEPDGSVSFEIFSESENSGRSVHFQGVATPGISSEVPRINLEEVRARCNQGSISAQESYEASARLGFKYGPSFRTLDHVYQGIGQVAATIRLPAQVATTLNQYVLHPSVMDAALQASMALLLDLSGNGSRTTASPALPYFADAIEILGPCTESMWAVVRPGQIKTSGNSNIRTCDIDVCDDLGNVCVQMTRFSFVMLDDDALGPGADQPGTAVLAPIWQETKHDANRGPERFREQLLLLCELSEASTAEIRKHLNAGYRSIASRPGSESSCIDRQFEEYALQLAEAIKQAIGSTVSGTRTLLQVVVPMIQGDANAEQQLFCGLSGMLRSAERENPGVVGQLIEWAPAEGVEYLLEKLGRDARHPEDRRVRYVDGRRWTLGWSSLPQTATPSAAPWKDHGIYLITGGTGALGQLLVNDLVDKVQGPTIILTGRHPVQPDSIARWNEWKRRGARLEFRQVDISNNEQVAALIREIRTGFGKLDGILHCAGINRDNAISMKSPAEIRAVLAPKVSGLVCLDHATREFPLEFFVLFSSIAAVVGNAGQSDYAAANGFMDAYAAYRNDLVRQGKCSGKTLSVNWPLWKEGGMRMSAELQQVMRQSTGLTPLETAHGLGALYRALASDHSQAMVVSGNVGQIQRVLLERTPAGTSPGGVERSDGTLPSSSGDQEAGSDILNEVQNDLIATLSSISKVDPGSIELDGELTQYGFDSLSLIALSAALNKTYGLDLTPALFFEYPSVRSLSAYLLENYRSAFESKLSITGKSTTVSQPEGREAGHEQARSRERFFSDVRSSGIVPAKRLDEPIAIVGMSGRFPMADTIEQFWDNLSNGKDCIGEIPRKRWNWEEYFGDPRKDGNKTNVKWGGFISGVDEFDPLFFGISPKEAELMDPNQRLLMEYVWKAIEDAGYSPQSLSGSKTAIIVGMGSSGYHSLAAAGEIPIESFTSTGMAPSLGPNRMSYFLNLRGPSEPIETACSSSLIALHRARILIQHGVCDMAVVGGINTLITPLLHISFSKAGMLCEDGRCKPFSDSANGYARGEGVGMLFLKRLKDAEQAGDHIYGVILGSAENHGGHATSLTAPNPHAQAEVIRTAYASAGVDPGTVTYIEAHGTGTALGDPVEINALRSVFKDSRPGHKATPDFGRCGIGSVKSNIGHLELAAGAAGIIKVLLQLRHRRLVKSLHCETLSPYIELGDSPFYVLQEPRDWQSIQGESGNQLPRRAGISSFGFGGVNAHVVIEEYARREERTVVSEHHAPFAIVLSAKSPERLQVIANNLLHFLEDARTSQPELHLEDLAYTLQVGRDAMPERMGIIVRSLDELRHKLEVVSQGVLEMEGLYRGTVKRRDNFLGPFGSDEERQRLLDSWIGQNSYAEILELWVQGLSIEWAQFYRGTRPRRISLPTYPFAQEKYWIDTYRHRSTRGAAAPGRLHPLVHENCSTLHEQKFRSVFSGAEFFLEDHVVAGRHVVPGVVYLEMARAAALLASGDRLGERFVRIRNVVWPRPLIVDQEPGQVYVHIYPMETEPEIRFEIRSLAKGSQELSQIHSQGWVLISAAKEHPTLNLKDLQQACAAESFSASECYALLAAEGLDISAGHRGIERVLVGKRQALVRLSLPGKLADSELRYGLHPCLMDSAVQGIAGFLLSSDEVNRGLSIKPGLPFAVEGVEVFGACEATMWAMVRASIAGKLQRFDFELVNDYGQCCVRVRGLSLRGIEGLEGNPLIESSEAAVLEDPRGITSVEAMTAAPSHPPETVGSETGTNGDRVIEEPILVSKSLDFVRRVLSTVIKLPEQRIDVDAALENYGIDSLMAVQLTDALEKVFGSLSKTLFFEYQTIRQLTDFFVEHHRDTLIKSLGLASRGKKAPRTSELAPERPAATAINRLPRWRFSDERAGTGVRSGKRSESIAIIGLSGRYPGADSVAEFWRNLEEGRDSITEIPTGRWNHSLYFDEDKTRPGKTYGKWGGFLRGVDEFDPLFFNISPRDAEYMDPQERLFLQCVYETIEDAGYTPHSLAQYRDASGLPGNVGVYAGFCYEEYQLYGAQETVKGRPLALAGIASSIANRVSYFFNFHGPSLALDTMCSSSLTALHLACESLQLGRCDAAIAGGVNVSVHPNKYLMLGQGKFLSSKGRCESFGEGGDGYVPSEGVGAVLLKRLDQAMADGDHIYGVIRGTAINHGGKTNGYTVPNPNAQASVIERAIEEAGVHPRTISYLEAHGTGTSLGDPIEIAGLNRAFLKHTEDRQFCSIGSVKSNIGHCESAAGIGGLTKVLLQMQHGRLVPSLHATPLNEAIDFEASPFVVQQHLDDWRRPEITIDGERKEYPRIAGVSSFGAGGSNAHVIVEEYIAAEPSCDDHDLPRENLIVLSARNEERLSVVAQNLCDFIRESCDSGRSLDFTSLAYTLQVGREAMRERLAIAAASIEEAQDRLHRWIRRETDVGGIYRGGSKESRDMLSLLVSDGDMQDTVTRWLEERKCEKLAALWVGGLSIDWSRMYQDPKPIRMSLPTYPFEKERYWVPATVGLGASGIHTGRAIHPLLHDNTSTFSEQRFTTTFTGDEPFLADHRVQGQPVLPGVAYLEMVRAGMEQASQIRADATVITMRNVVWSQPITVNGPAVRVHLGLSADEVGRIVYQVYGESPATSGDRVVYSRGEVLLRSWTEPPRLDVPDLLSRCDRGSFGPADCYALYSDLGIEYGPAHRGIEKIYVGKGEVLAKLKLPSTPSSGNDTYILHPGMLDSALQPSIYTGLADNPPLKPALPFALDEVEIFGPSTPEMWAYARLSAGTNPGGKTRRLDIDVCDEDGKVCVRLRGLSSRELTTVASKALSSAVSAQKDSSGRVDTFLLTPVWDSLAVDGNDLFPSPSSAMVVVGGNHSLEDAIRMRYANTRRLEAKTGETIEQIAERIRMLPALDHVLWVAPATRVSGATDEALITAQQEGVLLGFRLIKALLREGFGSTSLGMTVITTSSQRIAVHEDVNPAHASIHGLIGSLAKEYPAWRVRLLDMEANREWPIAEIFGVPADPQGNAAVYRQGEWYKQQLIQFVPEPVSDMAVSK